MKILKNSILLLLLLMTACHREESPTVKGSPASLSFTLSLPQVDFVTKTGYADGNVSPEVAATWADWERFVDGQLLYRVTLFLVREADDRLVGYRDFYWNGSAINDYNDNNASYGYNGFCTLRSDGTFNAMQPNNSSNKYGTAVAATFNFNFPMHGSIEKLASGSYKLYAVANYSSLTGIADGASVSHNYSGLKDCGGPSSGQGLTEYIDAAIAAFDASNGISSFSTTYASILNYEVKTARLNGSDIVYSGGTEQYICGQRPQPLTMVKDLSVLSGDNKFDGELVRTYARIRIALTNESQSSDLKVNEFTFVTPFSQSHAPLFDSGTYYPSDEGKPALTSDLAIHKYLGDNQVIAKALPGNPYNSTILFDAYILESSHTPDKYVYKLNVEYIGADSDKLILKDGQPIRKYQDLVDNYNDGYLNYLVWSSQAIINEYGAIYDGASDASKQYVYAKATGASGDNVKCFGEDGGILQVDKSSKVISSVSGNDLSDVRIGVDYLKYIWTFERVTSVTDYPMIDPAKWNISEFAAFNIKNLGTGGYWKNDMGIDNNHHSDPYFLTTSSTEFAPYIVFNLKISGGSLSFSNTNALKQNNGKRNTNYGYLSCGSTSNGDPGAVYSKGNQDNDFRAWFLYPLKYPNRLVKNIDLQVINHSTGLPYDLQVLRRNDFVNVDISVVFQPDGGVLKFIVKPWESGGGDVVFE